MRKVSRVSQRLLNQFSGSRWSALGVMNLRYNDQSWPRPGHWDPTSTTMKSIVLALLGIASLAAGAEWNALKATYGKNGQGYYDLPWSTEEAQGKWQKIDQDRKLNVDVYSQPQDPRMMLLFDRKGTIAGLRLAFLKDDASAKAREGGYTFEFDYDNNPFYEKGNYFGKDLWYATVLLASPNELASGGRSKLNKQRDDVANNIFFKENGKWTALSKDECKPNNEFVEANCFPGMGKHYFYKQNSDCKQREPFWTLYDNGKLSGFGLAGYGSSSKNPKTQSYYEEGNLPVQNIMRSAPPCVEEYINKYGLLSMHVFLKKDAANTACPQQDWRASHC